MFHIACQTIVYGNPVIKTEYARILKNIAQNGYEGVETGARHFYMDRPAYYQELLAENKLKMAAIHVGGDFLNPDSVQSQLDSIQETVQFAKRLNCPALYLSGCYRENKTDEDYLREAKAYTRIGQMCLDGGLVLCYHNHDWEIKDQLRGMKLLLDSIDPSLMKLVPDVGWVTVGGADAVEFLREHLDRVHALHFKDFTVDRSFTELGTGIVPFGRVHQFMKEHKDGLWISAEQDQATHTPEESSRINHDYIANLIS